MAFTEVRVNDGLIIYATDGGAEYSTDIVTLNSGYEARNQNWVNGRGQWQLGDRVVIQSEATALNTFFRARKGRAIGFRFKDWLDYKDEGLGVLATQSGANAPTSIGVGNGTPIYQMYKAYHSGTDYDYRMIRKPVAGTVALQRNGIVTNSYSLDTTTGLCAFIADASSNATAVLPGVTTLVVLLANPNTLVAGELLYLNGFAGANAAEVNAIAHTINSVTTPTPVSGAATASFATNVMTVTATGSGTFAVGAGVVATGVVAATVITGLGTGTGGLGTYYLSTSPGTIATEAVATTACVQFVLATNTNLAVISVGAGVGYAYPQAGDALTWTGQFDVPVRFDTDKFMARFDGADIAVPGVVTSGYFYISALPIIEVRV